MGRLKSAKEVHDAATRRTGMRGRRAARCALLNALKETSVGQARAVATLCPFANKRKGATLCLHVGAKGKKFTHDTP